LIENNVGKKLRKIFNPIHLSIGLFFLGRLFAKVLFLGLFPFGLKAFFFGGPGDPCRDSFFLFFI
jgi:hypothetical protein